MEQSKVCTENAARNVIISCKCGAEARVGQRTCLECHARQERNYRRDRHLSLEIWSVYLQSTALHADPDTRQHFEDRIDTHLVEVLTSGTDPSYIALPVGFLPDDVVIVADQSGHIKQVKLDQIINYGTKRRTTKKLSHPDR